jgi:dTDP-4-dehydrorhamnose 3,5-epimerase
LTRFSITDLSLVGLKLIERKRVGDARGYLSRLFCRDELAAAGWHKPVAQINHTSTALCGTVRGLHYQIPPHTEMKVVTCIRGEVWDVAIDLRAHSPTFLQWQAQILSANNANALLIPEGFGHGFQTLVDDCELIYIHTESYAPQAEAALRFDDPRLAINWPLPVSGISDRDKAHPLLTAQFNGVKLQ